MKQAVNLRSHIQAHPLQFLLWLEWIVLGLVALCELPRIDLALVPRIPWLNALGLGVLLVMGLRLPQRSRSKLFYFSVEMGLGLVLSWVSGMRLFQLLFLVILMRNCLLFRGVTNAIAATTIFVFYAVTQLHRLVLAVPLRGMAWPRLGLLWLSLLVLFGLIVLFLQMLVDAIWQERQGREQLALANDQLRHYTLKIEDQATLQERNRIAREIHDSLGHSLTIFNLHLAAALQLLDTSPGEAKDLLVEAKQVGSKALREVRQSVATLRSDPLEGRSLQDSITALVDEFQRSTQISPTCQIHVNQPIPASLTVALYRITQEALTNIYRYAGATMVSIQIEAESTLSIRIEDNGKGFDLDNITTGFGLQGMRERTLALSGEFSVVTAPGQGCQILACFPLPSR